MNAFTKVLVILVLVLSLIFAATQVVLYGKRVKLGDALTQKTAQLDTANKQVKDLTTQLSDKTATTDRTIADLRTQAQDLQGKLETANQDVQRLQKEKGQQVASVNDLTATNQRQLDTLNQKIAALDQADKDKADLRSQIQDKTQKLAQVTADLKASEARAGDLDQQLTEVKKERKKLADANEDMTAQLVALRQRGIETTAAFAPPISAKVITVDAKLHTAVIDKGSTAGVKRNTEFTIYRDSQYVAHMYITDVDQQVAAGQVTLLAKGLEPEQGDDATTTIR